MGADTSIRSPRYAEEDGQAWLRVLLAVPAARAAAVLPLVAIADELSGELSGWQWVADKRAAEPEASKSVVLH